MKKCWYKENYLVCHKGGGGGGGGGATTGGRSIDSQKATRAAQVAQSNPKALEALKNEITKRKKQKAEWKPLSEFSVINKPRIQTNREKFNNDLATMEEALRLAT